MTDNSYIFLFGRNEISYFIGHGKLVKVIIAKRLTPSLQDGIIVPMKALIWQPAKRWLLFIVQIYWGHNKTLSTSFAGEAQKLARGAYKFLFCASVLRPVLPSLCKASQ